jgi:FG-GAP-like repeat
MIRIACRSRAMITLIAQVFSISAFASAQAWTADHGALPVVASDTTLALEESSKDPQGEASPLMVISDFNRDGIADIAKVALHAKDPSETNRLTVLLGQTNGNFKKMAPEPALGRAPRAMIASDFNKDGNTDLIVGDDEGTLTLFFGDGTGNFNPGDKTIHLDSVASIAVADFNKDGVLDLAVSDWRASSVTVLLGIGNGSFPRMWSFPLRMRGTSPHIAAADFNGDGVPDLAVVYDDEDGDDTFDVMLGNGNGTFTIAPDRGFVRDPNSHCNT